MKKLMNTGRRPLGLSGSPSVVLRANVPVEVSDQQFEQFMANRTVSRWINSGLISVDGEKAAVDVPKPTEKVATKERPEPEIPDGLTGKGPEKHHLGGGWYEGYVNGVKVTDRNMRKAEIESVLSEYEG